jgi:hypothetical protein
MGGVADARHEHAAAIRADVDDAERLTTGSPVVVHTTGSLSNTTTHHIDTSVCSFWDVG